MPISFDAAQIAVVVKETFEPTFYRTFVANTFFARFLDDTVGARFSYVEKDITWKAYISGTPGAGSYAEDGPIGLTRTDLGPRYHTARLGWRQQRVPIRVSGLAQAISRSPNSLIDVVGENTKDSLLMLQRNMNKQALSDGLGNLNGPDPELNAFGLDLTGVQAMWDDGSVVPIYAGIDRSVNTYWRSFVLADELGVGRPITEQLMHQMLNELRGVREADVTDILCSLAMHTQVGLLLGQDRRYVFSGNEDPSYHGGFMKAFFNGIEITGVPLYQTGRMDFFDRKLLRFPVLLDITIETRDPGDLDAMAMYAKTYGQLLYRNPFHSGSIRDLLETG